MKLHVNIRENAQKKSKTKGKTVNMNNKNNLGGQIWGTKFNIIA